MTLKLTQSNYISAGMVLFDETPKYLETKNGKQICRQPCWSKVKSQNGSEMRDLQFKCAEVNVFCFRRKWNECGVCSKDI